MHGAKLPYGWKLSALGEVILGKPQYGLNARSSTKKNEIVYLRISDITDEGELKTEGLHYIDANSTEVGKYELHENDFLIARSGSVGRVYLHHDLGKPSVFASYLIRFRLDSSKVLPKFVFYWGLSPHFKREIGARRKVVAQPNINAKDYCRFMLLVPPLEIQQRIASVLEKAHKLKQKRKEANQLSLRIIRSIFLKMFGHGIPQNKIDDVVEFVSSGSTPLGGEKTYVADGIVFIRSQNVLMNELKLDDVAHITEQVHNQMRRTWVKDGDVLLNITGASMGRVAFYRGPDDKANVNQHVCIIRLNKHKALPEYISYYLSSSNAQKQIWTIQAGASRQALNFEQVKSLSLYLPPLSEQQKFATIVRTTQALRGKQTQSAMQIDELFHSLMHKAFRGELVAEIKKLSEKKITSPRTLGSYLDRNVLS